ncbi:MAG: hypothetical protein ACXIVE_18305 [Salinarimonas sp.]
MSNENGENKDKIDDILASDAENQGPNHNTVHDSLEELKKKISELDAEIQSIGQNSKNKFEYLNRLNQYIDSAKSELNYYKWIRLFMIGFALIFVAFLQALLICVIFFHQLFFYLQGPYFRSALVLATIGGSVVIISLVLRGVFRLAAEQNVEHQMPQEMRGMLNTANTINQSQGG